MSDSDRKGTSGGEDREDRAAFDRIVLIERLLVKPTAITAVCWVSTTCKHTSAAPAAFTSRIMVLVPGIAHHLCAGAPGDGIEDISSMLTAHLFEHLVLEVLLDLDMCKRQREGSRAGSGAASGFGGFTSWDHTQEGREESRGDGSPADIRFPGRLPYRITVQTPDDFIGIAAFRLARDLLDEAWQGDRSAADLEVWARERKDEVAAKWQGLLP